jgi:hypothetical protein
VTEVRDDPERRRFEIVVDAAVAGFAQYREHDGRIVFLHTEIDPAHEDQGDDHRQAREDPPEALMPPIADERAAPVARPAWPGRVPGDAIERGRIRHVRRT